MDSDVSTKKAQAREAFQQFAERFYQRHFGQIGHEHLHEGLTRFYIQEIFNRLHNPIDDEDFDSGYVNASDDLGIDFIYRNDQTVLIIQTKYKGSRSPVEHKEILHFQTIFERLIKHDFKKNKRLEEALADIDLARDHFICKFVSFGKIIGQAATQVEQEIPFPRDDLGERTEFEFLGEDELTKALRDAYSLSAGSTGSCDLFSAGERAGRYEIIELLQNKDTPEERKSAVLVVAAQQLVGLYDQYKSALFSLNIRNFLGNTATNKQIISTLRNEPENFYYYNNGIACLADDFHVEKDRVHATNLQIINGAQTVRCLHKASKNRELKEAVQKAHVLVRITKSSSGYGSAGRFRNAIVRSNNTQNVIKISDFKSNDPIQEDLKRKFKEYRRDAKEIAYVPKRTDPYDLRNRYIIQMEEFAKVIYSFLRDPISFSANTSFLFDDSENGGYLHVFGDGKQVYTVMPDPEFKLRSAIWWLADEFNKKLKEDRTKAADPIEKAAIERKWMLLYVARLVLERSYGGIGYQAELMKHYRGEWRLNEERLGCWMAEIYNVSKEALVYKYSEDAKRPGFIHRNWMRNINTVKDLQDYVKRAPRVQVDKLKDSKPHP